MSGMRNDGEGNREPPKHNCHNLALSCQITQNYRFRVIIFLSHWSLRLKN